MLTYKLFQYTIKVVSGCKLSAKILNNFWTDYIKRMHTVVKVELDD